MNLVIGALTPPLGVLVFTTARVGGANQTETFKAIVPFVLALVVRACCWSRSFPA